MHYSYIFVAAASGTDRLTGLWKVIFYKGLVTDREDLIDVHQTVS